MSIHYLLEQFFNWILSFEHNEVLFLSLAIIFFASVFESLPFTGMFFPSESITVFFGIIAYKGVVDIKILIIATYIGILLGDIIGYIIGTKVGEEFLKKHAKRVKIDSKKYEKIKNILKSNLIKALFIGRSNGFTRWIVPFLAGANKINFQKFILSNMLTAAFWAPAFLLGGYYLGSAFEAYGKYFGLGIITATIVSVMGYKSYQHLRKEGFFQSKDTKLLLINIFGLYLFSKMAEDVLDTELVTKLDFWMHVNMSEIYMPFLTKMMIMLTFINNPLPSTVIILVITFYLGFKRYINEMLFFIFSLTGSVTLMFIIKSLIKRARPLHHLVEVSGYSFPSGHAVTSTALAFSLYLILSKRVKYKKTLLSLCIIYPLIISFSRVYLSVHYLSDVIAGIGLSLFWVSLTALVFEGIKNRKSF